MVRPKSYSAGRNWRSISAREERPKERLMHLVEAPPKTQIRNEDIATLKGLSKP